MKQAKLLSLSPLILIGATLFSPITYASTVIQKDKAVITTLFAQTKPQCVGRYIIDVPQSFNNQSNDMIFIDNFRIESQLLYPPAFKQRLALREKELKDEINKPGNDLKNAPFIKEIIQLPEGKGVIFDRNESGADDVYRKLEAHIYMDMMAFIITTDIRDFSDKKYEIRKLQFLERGFTDAQANEKPVKLAAMKSLISRLSGRNDESIPTEKGLCIPNGFIKDDGGKHQEKVTFSYKNEDFILGLYMNNTFIGSNDTLFNRSAQINKALSEANQYTIKKSELSPNGIPSQMWLFGGNQKLQNTETSAMEVHPIYDFTFYANEAGSSPSKPWLSISIANDSKKTRYSEAEMVEIWDRIVNSLRYRPNAF